MAFPVPRRIQQLEACLEDEKLSHQHINLQAAIQMYKSDKLEYGHSYTLFVQGKVMPMNVIPKDLMM